MRSRLRLAPSVLRSAVSPLLPEPIEPRDVAIVSRRDGIGALSKAPAVLVVGYPSQRGMIVDGAPRLPERISFRALPGFGAPRALLPSAVGDAAERVSFRPRAVSESLASRVKTKALTNAIHLAWPFVSTPIQMYLPQPSPVVGALKDAVPECELGVFIGNGANHGRSAVQAFTSDGDLAAVCRFITDSTTSDRARVEYGLLQYLHRQPSLRPHVPTPHRLVESHLGVGVVTDAFAGTSGPTQLDPALEAWLDLCVSKDEIQASSSSIVSHLVRRSPTLGDYHHSLPTVAADVAQQMERETVRQTIIHGDFTPWNMLMDHGQLRLFDWEYGAIDGLPDWDAIFFELQVGIVHHRWSSEHLLAEALVQGARPSDHFSPHGRAALVVLILIDIALRCAERHDEVEAGRISNVAMESYAHAGHI
jgi:Phosphotransferase enzyme family